MKVLIAGGGTAGHINPALSIAKYIKSQESDSEFLFVGTKAGMEKDLVPAQGFPIEFIDVRGLVRSLSFENVKTVFRVLHAQAQVKKLIKEFKPDAVICTGGYVSGPVMYAAKSMHIPSLIHEQNVVPGVAVKMSVKYANFVATSFAETSQYIHDKKKCVLVGNPVRASLFEHSKSEARQELHLDDRPFILAFGGSLGADRINETVIEYLAREIDKRRYQILFGCGKRNYSAVLKAIADKGIDLSQYPHVQVVDYINNMDVVMNAADVVISRAGAISVSEITALGKASILIPSPNVAHDHQTYNALSLYKNEAGLMIKESDLSVDSLENRIHMLLEDDKKRALIEHNAKQMGITDACEKIYKTIKSAL